MDTTAVQRKRPGLVGAILAATNFLAVFDGFVVVVALPAIQGRFSLGALTGQWIITAYALPPRRIAAGRRAAAVTASAATG
ncbi:hypothetical protein ACWED2_10105 [Amycolatopsis sp. NPDC005003]